MLIKGATGVLFIKEISQTNIEFTVWIANYIAINDGMWLFIHALMWGILCQSVDPIAMLLVLYDRWWNIPSLG